MAGVTPLDPRFVALQREVGRYVTALASVGLLVGLLVLLGPRRWYFCIPLWATGTVALGWWLYRWPAIVYRCMGYRLDDEGLEITSGVVWRQVSNIPRSRVQHTDVAQGPLERKHGLGRLIVYTAGTSHSKVELPGLAHEVAFEIRHHLLPHQSADGV